MKTQLFQHISFTTLEKDGSAGGGIYSYKAEMTLDECKAKYLAMRVIRSLKGFYNPEPVSITNTEILEVC